METCPHCDSPVSPEAPYCPGCGQPRMLESLLTPRPLPSWQATFWNGVAIAAVLLFLVSSSVAFLREAKAVRVARQALVSNQDSLADQILEKFIGAHPSHEEALFLGSQAAIRMERLKKGGEFRSRLEKLQPGRLTELDPELGRLVDVAIARKSCFASGILDYYDRAKALSSAFGPRILADVQQAVRRCQASKGGQDAAFELMVGMVKRGAGASLVEETYLVPLRGALAAGRYAEAESLARGASRVSSEARKSVDGLLAGLRSKVESSVQDVDKVCGRIAASPGNRVGRFWCFPEATPPAARASDAWGHTLQYQAVELDKTLHCYQGFELRSYGADGRDGPAGDETPAGDIECRVVSGHRTWNYPGRFWRKGS